MSDSLSNYFGWAPDGDLWTPWVKPVLFAGQPAKSCDLKTLTPEWITQADAGVMLIIDLPGKTGVEEGLAAARAGYRPVPLYNGVCGPDKSNMIVDVTDIKAALARGAGILPALNLMQDAPPAFLLDADRMSGAGKKPGMYDNRWCVFPQDMPSAMFLVKNGIKKIIVRSDKLQIDLQHILLRYQKSGIKIYLCCDGSASGIIKTTVPKPGFFRTFSYRFKVTMGLTRNAAGGFGGKIPDPQTSSSGSYYGGFG